MFAAGVLALGAASASANAWQTAGPAYRGVENLADGVYSLVRGHLFTALLPDRLTQRMAAVPSDSSDHIFAEQLEKSHEHARRRILDARPMEYASSPAALDKWRDTALQAEQEAATDALADTLLRRYQLERFGRDSGDYALNPSNWDAGFMTSAAVLGGAYLYAAGLRTDWMAGPLRVDLDTPAGPTLRTISESGEGHLADLRLSRPGSPLSVKSAWGLRSGRLGPESFGVAYTSRF